MRLGRLYAVCGLLLTLLCVVGAFCVLRAQPQPERKQLAIYTPQTTYSVPVLDRDGREYVGLAEVLSPLCRVSDSLSRKKWKLRCKDREVQLPVGQTKVRVNKQDLVLSAPPLADNGRGLVPLHSLAILLPQLLPDRPSTLHEQSRRLFLDRSELHYAAEMRKTAPSQLVLSFSAPVNPSIATEPGRLRMLFRKEPVVATTGLETLRFDDRLIHSLSYSEASGAAELAVSATVPLTASFSPDRRAITITPLQRPPEPERVPVPAPPASTPQPPQAVSASSEFVVVIDPAHGGEDSGAAISEKQQEKDLTLAIARVLYRELDSLGITVRLVRDGDNTIAPEQRAVMANASGASLFISVHASTAGTGVHLFTSRLKSTPRRTGFLPWDTAQSGYVATSQGVATSIATELLKHDVPGEALTAALRPLNHVAAPAVAVELASPPNGDKLSSPSYQQLVCKAIAGVVASSRATLLRGGAR